MELSHGYLLTCRENSQRIWGVKNCHGYLLSTDRGAKLGKSLANFKELKGGGGSYKLISLK